MVLIEFSSDHAFKIAHMEEIWLNIAHVFRNSILRFNYEVYLAVENRNVMGICRPTPQALLVGML